MPKFKCCRQTFTSKSALDGHTSAHPPSWGKNSEGCETEKQTENANTQKVIDCATAVMPPPISPPLRLHLSRPPAFISSSPASKSSQSLFQSSRISSQNQNSTKRQGKRKRPPENSSEWQVAMETLLSERSRLLASPADTTYWDLAVETLVTVRSCYCSSNSSRTTSAITPQRRAIVPLEEHRQVMERLAEVIEERDTLKAKWEASETKRMVLELIEKQYKRMLSLRTEEIYKVKKMAIDSPLENRGFVPYGIVSSISKAAPAKISTPITWHAAIRTQPQPKLTNGQALPSKIS